jgi:anti-sigma regulatory factor (Ser/Thr protein kinase)
LLNVALADARGFSLLCPYDVASLPTDVLDEAGRSHEYVSVAGTGRISETYSGVETFARPLSSPLTDAPDHAEVAPVTVDTLQSLRRLVSRYAAAAGLNDSQTIDLVFVANEVASNSIVHAGGSGLFRIWRESDAVVFETRDRGRITRPLVGRERPGATQVGGLGLWLANQLCDLVQIRTFDDGSVVRVRMSR